ncbi:MAG: twin-arginine translocation signal domain-containing protein, partial [Candidatus Omnitrophica bacterium COP1]|nr:twin-arginine translocation signal domain-containing protein [Candidatus Omnitrophica bacterium COP1]
MPSRRTFIKTTAAGG